jgi:hypothetical protein
MQVRPNVIRADRPAQLLDKAAAAEHGQDAADEHQPARGHHRPAELNPRGPLRATGQLGPQQGAEPRGSPAGAAHGEVVESEQRRLVAVLARVAVYFLGAVVEGPADRSRAGSTTAAAY